MNGYEWKPGPIAAPLYEAIGPDAFAIVGQWLRDVVSDGALEVEDVPGGRVIAPSLPWLVEAVSFYEPPSSTQ